MARRSGGKPYDIAVQKAAQFQEELTSLPRSCIKVIVPFLHPKLTEDDFHKMVELYYEVKQQTKCRLIEKAIEAIRGCFAEQRRENNALYNPYRNISLNQCIGDSRSPVSDWLNTNDWQEWG